MSTSKAAKRLGFLATGSEITTGEIANTNSQIMAAQLQDFGTHIGEHLVCDDTPANIEASLQFLLERHDAVIITGGLGPTSDDCTREVVAKLSGQKLIFNEKAWAKIVERLSKRKLAIPDNNKQQAYFPAKANIIDNANGTACGCHLYIGDTLVFLLPGPPRECLPIFKEYVLPMLLKENFNTNQRLFRWRLLNASESMIATLLEPIAEKHKLNFGYRAHYPFTDVKLFLDPHTKFHTKILLEVEALLRPYFVTHLNQALSAQLQEQLMQRPITIYLDDEATKGAFKQALLNPTTADYFVGKNVKADLEIYLTGLDDYWADKTDNTLLDLKLELRYGKKTEHFESSVLMRGKETINYAIEFAAWKILGVI